MWYLVVCAALFAWHGLVTHDDWLLHHFFARKNVANGILAIGALIASYGLLRAYIRSAEDITVWQWITHPIINAWRRLRHKTQHVGPSGIASGTTWGFHGVARGLALHHVDTTLPLQEQIELLAQYVNKRSTEAAEMDKKIGELGQELEKVKDGSAQLERKVLAHIESQIKDLNDKLNRTQVLDLRCAIAGLFITFIGICWGLGA